MNTKRNLYLAILVIVTVVCVIVGITVHSLRWWNNNFLESLGNGGSRALTSVEEDLSGVTALSIDLSVGELHIEMGDMYRLYIFSSERLLPKTDVRGGKLSIKQAPVNNPWRLGAKERCAVTITVPKGTVIADADISGDVGELTFSGVEFETLSIKTNVGECDLSAVNVAQDLTIDADVGDAKLSNVSCARVEVDMNVGSFTAKDFLFDKCTIESDTGDVELNIGAGQDMEEYTVDLTNDIGTVSYFSEKERHEYHQNGTTEKYLSIDSDVGDITVK